MQTAREAILGRVRGALGRAPDDQEARHRALEHPAEADASGESRQGQAVGREDLLERFVERSAEYRATVRRARAAELPDLLAAICAEHEATRLACPADLPTDWRPEGLELISDDPPLSARALDGLDGVLTACAFAAAETGTVVLDHGRGQGRRALTLLPDLHVCVIDPADVLADIPQVISALADAIEDGRPITLVSGPSATSDIELERVEGVHGPRRLELVLLEAGERSPRS